ncbi:MAG: RraA family protein [Chloroflexi bacterium]|nr:RraA family protein [Chloroflexota bacterium]
MADLTRQQLDTLGKIQTCAVANAIETFDVMPRNQGFMRPAVRSIFPGLGSMIGYAVTGVISAKTPPTSHMRIPRSEWVDYVLSVPEPRVIMLQDLDYPDVLGSFWGEVQSNVHQALGCVGTVTDGGVRDLDEMREAGFFAFATEVLVSHAYVHIVEYGVPVTIGGLTVSPGDIVMGDQHGVLTVPKDIAADIPKAVEEVEKGERRIIDFCRSSSFTSEGLKELLAGRY